MIIRVDKIPNDAIEMEPDENGNYIVAHSETGHHHVVAARTARVYAVASAMYAYMRVLDGQRAELEHLRPWETHEAYSFEPGEYQIVRQREGAPEGWRMVAD